MKRTRFAFQWRGSTYDLKSLCFYPTTWLRVRYFWRSYATGFCGVYCPAFLPVIFKTAHFPPQRSSPAPSIPLVLGIQIFLTSKQPQFRHQLIFDLFKRPCRYYGRHLPELWRERDKRGLSKLWEIRSSKSK